MLTMLDLKMTAFQMLSFSSAGVMTKKTREQK
nr:MAG TPA: hypothetical protein [Caudoviricetes sp.]